LVPLFKRSCTGCHHPGKLKGELDLTSYASFQKGGKHGPAFKAGDPAGSLILDEIRAPDPSMPKEGDPLTSQEVELFERWIQEGAPDDTPPEALSFQPKEPPVYAAPAVVSALAFSPDGQLLAISGRHEVFLFDAAELRLLDRLLGEAPRIESLCFSPDGTFLALAGGAPARFGEVQIWDLATRKAAKTWRISADSLYGLSVSPDSARVAFGAADRLVRVLAVADGKELVRFDNHSDWVLGTLFTVDGRRLLSGSRDQAMKLIDAATGQFIDDINKHFEGVLCMARHPREDVVAYGGDQGTPRIYRISDNQNRTAANNDVNQLRELERQPGPVYAIAYSPDASVLAVAAAGGQVQLYRTADGARARTLPGHSGPVFSLAFHPKQPRLATGGFDGLVRVFDFPSGELVAVFTPVEIEPGAGVVAAR
jgi:WD40 repeat protein